MIRPISRLSGYTRLALLFGAVAFLVALINPDWFSSAYVDPPAARTHVLWLATIELAIGLALGLCERFGWFADDSDSSWHVVPTDTE